MHTLAPSRGCNKYKKKLLLGHQGQSKGPSCGKEEGKPLNSEEECQAARGIPLQEKAIPFNCEPSS